MTGWGLIAAVLILAPLMAGITRSARRLLSLAQEDRT
jgi:hypothetical protein